MNYFDRRRFLQSASLIVAGGYAPMVFGKEACTPAFAESPTFNPCAFTYVAA